MPSVMRSFRRWAALFASDLAARIGGEEFAVFLVEAGRDKTLEVAERIRQNMRVSDGQSASRTEKSPSASGFAWTDQAKP